MPNPNQNTVNPLLDALAKMLLQSANPVSSFVDKNYVAQMQGQRQTNAFEQAKQEDYYNKVRALNELRAQGTNPSAMFQKANNFVGDYVTGNTPRQMGENLALSTIPIGKMLMAIAPVAGKAFNAVKRELPIENYPDDLTKHGIDKIYREMGAGEDGAMSFLGRNSNGYMKQMEYYFADTPELAIGQGTNKGVIVELNAGGLKGKADFSKPMAKQMYQDGTAEYIVKYNSQKDYLDRLSAVTIKPDLKVASKTDKIRLQQALNSLEASGFVKTQNPDGSITWRKQ